MNLIKPSSIQLEASIASQLKCPSYETAQGKIYEKLGKGFLLFENFQRIVDENFWIKHIEISNWGEIFLDPEF